MVRRQVVIELLALLIFACAAAAVAEGHVSSSSSASSTASWDSIFTSQNLTGVANGWIGFNNNVYSNQFGYSNVPLKAPMPRDARFPIASNTKLFVAIGLYQLQERGKVNLTDSIADYLTAADFAAMGVAPALIPPRYCPIVPGNNNTNQCETITFVQLLDMTSGIANNNGQFMPYPGSLALVVGSAILQPLLFKPGTQYYYSNTGFMLASFFIEKLSGMTFNEYIQTYIAKPLGMTNTYFDVYNGKFGLDEKRVGEYYEFLHPQTKAHVASGVCSSEFDLGSAAGAGGIVSTQDDEMRLYYQLFNFTSPTACGRPLLSSCRSLHEIVRPRTLISAGFYYAQGLFISASGPRVEDITLIQYEGQIMCSHTSNIFDITVSPPIMTQTWSNVDVFYQTAEQLAAINTAAVGNFWQVTSAMPHRPSLSSMSQQLNAAIKARQAK